MNGNVIADKLRNGRFRMKDIKWLCSRMGFDHENLSYETRNGLITALILETKKWGSFNKLNEYVDDYIFESPERPLPMPEDELLQTVDNLLLMSVELVQSIHDYNQRKISVQLAQAYATVASALMQRLEIARGERD